MGVFFWKNFFDFFFEIFIFTWIFLFEKKFFFTIFLETF